MSARLKDIPALARDGSNIKAWADSMSEVVQTFRGYRGDPLDEALTLRNAQARKLLGPDGLALYPNGIPGPRGASGPPGADGGTYVPELTPPPTPTGLSVTAGITALFVEQDTPVYTVGHGHDRTVVFGAKWPQADLVAPTFSDAVHLFDFQGDFGAYVTDPSTRWCIWIKWRSMDGVESAAPAGGTNGAQATTAVDVSLLVRAMTGPGNPFKVVTSPITLPDGSIVPVGTYTADAYIHNGFITNAKIANLAVTDAKIATLGVSKLTAGSINVGAYIQSPGFTPGAFGWRVNGDGTSEFAQVIVRGAVFASVGAIGGSVIGSNYMRSTNYVFNTTGWSLNSNGTGQIGGFQVGDTFINSANYSAGLSGWRLDNAGNLEANQGIFRGALIAATGTFAGAINVGAFSAFAWPAAGGTGAHLSANGLMLGNANPSAGNPAGKYFQVSTPAGGVPTISTNIPAYLEDLQVTTLKIGPDQVTVPAGVTNVSNVAVGFSFGFQVMMSVSMDTAGAPVYVNAFLKTWATNPGGAYRVFGLFVNGIERARFTTGLLPETGEELTYPIAAYVAAPGSGTFTVDIRGASAGGGGNTNLSAGSVLFAIGVKR